MALKGLMTRGVQGVTGQARPAEGGEGARTEPNVAAPRAVVTQAPGPRTVAPSTSVDAGSELEGRLRCKETLRIDGRIVGEIECDKSVIIGEGARVHASIDADEVQVSGIVEGDITARRKVTLDRTAVVVGDLTTPGIVIEEGAKLKGRILIGSDAEAEDMVAKARDTRTEQPKAMHEASPADTHTEKRTGEVDAASAPNGSAPTGSKKTKKASGASREGGEAQTAPPSA